MFTLSKNENVVYFVISTKGGGYQKCATDVINFQFNNYEILLLINLYCEWKRIFFNEKEFKVVTLYFTTEIL